MIFGVGNIHEHVSDFLFGELDILRRGAVRRVIGVRATDVGDFCDHVVGHGEDSDTDVLETHAYRDRKNSWMRFMVVLIWVYPSTLY